MFFVQGIPIPKGSTRAFMRPGMKFPVTTNDNPKTKQWEQAIREGASQAGCRGDYTGPVWVHVEFLFPRIKGDYTKFGAVKASAPTRHTKKPDLDKLCRALLDGLIGEAMADDSQVVSLIASKRWARLADGEKVGAVVTLDFEKATQNTHVPAQATLPAEEGSGATSTDCVQPGAR